MITAVVVLLGCLLKPQVVGQRCGVERWAVKTGTDSNAGAVNLGSPQTTTIADLIALAPPSPFPANNRFAPVEDIDASPASINPNYSSPED